MARGHEPREDRGEGRAGPVAVGARLVEAHALFRQAIQGRSRRASVAVGAQAVRAQRVDGDQDHEGIRRRSGGLDARIRPQRMRVPRLGQRAQDERGLPAGPRGEIQVDLFPAPLLHARRADPVEQELGLAARLRELDLEACGRARRRFAREPGRQAEACTLRQDELEDELGLGRRVQGRAPVVVGLGRFARLHALGRGERQEQARLAHPEVRPRVRRTVRSHQEPHALGAVGRNLCQADLVEGHAAHGRIRVDADVRADQDHQGARPRRGIEARLGTLPGAFVLGSRAKRERVDLQGRPSSGEEEPARVEACAIGLLARLHHAQIAERPASHPDCALEAVEGVRPHGQDPAEESVGRRLQPELVAVALGHDRGLGDPRPSRVAPIEVLEALVEQEVHVGIAEVGQLTGRLERGQRALDAGGIEVLGELEGRAVRAQRIHSLLLGERDGPERQSEDRVTDATSPLGHGELLPERRRELGPADYARSPASVS